jgi:hypothetical protein
MKETVAQAKAVRSRRRCHCCGGFETRLVRKQQYRADIRRISRSVLDGGAGRPLRRCRKMLEKRRRRTREPLSAAAPTLAGTAYTLPVVYRMGAARRVASIFGVATGTYESHDTDERGRTTKPPLLRGGPNQVIGVKAPPQLLAFRPSESLEKTTAFVLRASTGTLTPLTSVPDGCSDIRVLG